MGMRETDPTVTFRNVICKRATERAILVEIDGEEHWIPQSHVHPDSEVYDDDANAEGTLVISEWIAEQKNLI